MSARDEALAKVVAEWARGDLYEAHETLEELAEHVEDDDADHEIALALVHVAACLHKLANDVGKGAVPAKLGRALEVLNGAPATWLGLDLGALREELAALHTDLVAHGVTRAFTLDELPKLRRG